MVVRKDGITEVSIFNIITLLGGLALFLYGMRIMGDGLKEGSTDTLKSVLEKVTNNPVKGFLVGMLMTAIIQSSTATIVITSGLVGAGILTLHQSVGIILGANVGTTVTGQIIRLLDVNASGTSWLNFFKPQTLAPIAAVIGIICIMFLNNKKARTKTIGTVAMGFGILFTGLLTMTGAVEPLSKDPAFTSLFVRFGDNPILAYLVGVAVAFVLQSSSATIGILQAFSITGALTFKATYPIIIGVYLGDCVTTAMVCSIGAKADAKRTGAIHIMFNLCETVVVFLAVTILHKCGVLDGIWNATMNSGMIANTHTVFNLSCAILLMPLAGVYEKLSLKLIPDDKVLGTSIDAELAMLDTKLYASPALALNSAKGAIKTMAKLSQEAVVNAMNTFDEYNQESIDIINENEERIDRLADAVDNYLVGLGPHVPDGKNNDMLNYYMQCFSEFERIGDYAVNLTENASDLHSNGAQFTPQAKNELLVVSSALRDILTNANAAFSNMDFEAARRIEPVEEVVDDLVATLRSNHTRRLREGRCNMYSGLEFLDVLVNVERVADQCSNIGVYTLGLTDEHVHTSHHDYIHELHQGNDEFFNEEYKTKHDYYFNALSMAERTR